MKNILIHEWRGYKKAKTFTTYGYISIFNQDVFRMFDNAAKRIDALLWYKKEVTDVKFKSKN